MQNNSPSGTPPEKPSGDGGQGGPTATASNVTHTGATTLSETASTDAQTYASVTGGENALLVTAGEVTLNSPTVTKSGDESSEDSDFYGTNAAVLATGGVININGGSVETSGAHANGIFAYGDGKIVVKNTTVKTTSNNSGGIMVTGGGYLEAENVTVTTAGNSSAPIRSDRGGGTMTVTGGSFTSNGIGSPAIYSTADINVSGAALTATSSEGVVIEGSNSVHLENVTLTDTNNSLNGNSETYKNIFIYQSMSGDASEGTGTFSANNSTITTNQGDTFFVTNTTANISLENNRIVNNDASSAFLRAQSGKWGTAGANGGIVKLSLTKQVAEGDIVLDSVSSLSLVLSDQSFYMGIINGANTAQSIDVTLDATSQLILAGDSYINTLTNADSTNMNIYSNGYKLYVAGSEVEINGSEAPEVPEASESTTGIKDWKEAIDSGDDSRTLCLDEGGCGTNYAPFIVGGIALLVIIGAIVAFVIHNKKKKGGPTQGDSVISPDGSMTTPGAPADARPDFSQFDDDPVQQPTQPSQPQPQPQPPRQQPPLVGRM